VLRDGLQVTEFQEGIVPWALQRPVALIFDEYDAGRPDVMFVIQRMLERDGKFTLLDQNRVIQPHPDFRLFATANTVGLGNLNGLYHGTQRAQPRPDRPLEHRRHAELPAARRGGGDRAGARALDGHRGRPQAGEFDGGDGRADAQRPRRGRPDVADVAAHRDHLGREPARSSATRRRPSACPSSTSATRSSARWWPSTTSAASMSNCPRRRGQESALMEPLRSRAVEQRTLSSPLRMTGRRRRRDACSTVATRRTPAPAARRGTGRRHAARAGRRCAAGIPRRPPVPRRAAAAHPRPAPAAGYRGLRIWRLPRPG
jgi:hypothetical protein